MKINLHVERVILEGVPGDEWHFRQALAQELSRKLIAGGLSSEMRRGGAVPIVRGGAIEASRKHSATNLGKQVAGAIYGGIGTKR